MVPRQKQVSQLAQALGTHTSVGLNRQNRLIWETRCGVQKPWMPAAGLGLSPPRQIWKIRSISQAYISPQALCHSASFHYSQSYVFASWPKMWEQVGRAPADCRAPQALWFSQSEQTTVLGLQVKLWRLVLPVPIASSAAGPAEPPASHLERQFLSRAILNRSG